MLATDHPAYHDALGYAVTKAQRKHGDVIAVYFDGERMYVREHGEAMKPEGCSTICIVQCYGQAVRMRFPRDGTDVMGRPRPKLPQPYRHFA